MMLDWEAYLQGIIAVFVITDPIGRPVFFAMLTQGMSREERRAAAIKVIRAVAIILVGAALIGKGFLDVIGIHLGAFGFVGGVIVALMGFEMMAMGEPSKAQGGSDSRQEPRAEDQLLVPFAMPFIAGPGAITIVITLASSGEGSISVALVSVAVSVLAMCVTFIYFTDYLSQISERTMAIVTKFGGLLIATIGAQLALNGLKSFFDLAG
jgi:multiple antibiotic resistance protein